MPFPFFKGGGPFTPPKQKHNFCNIHGTIPDDVPALEGVWLIARHVEDLEDKVAALEQRVRTLEEGQRKPLPAI
jgi:hypothetical protein